MKCICIFLMCLTLMACTTKTKYGECYGLRNNIPPNQSLQYEVSWWNIAMGIILMETLVVPLNVAGWNFYCPTGTKN